MELWHDFFLGELGASAALIGLVFVAVSINLNDILKSSALVSRVLEALESLVVVLFTASAILIPMGGFTAWGIVLLVIALLYWVFLSFLQVGVFRSLDAEYRKKFFRIIVITQLAALLFFLGALGLIIYGEGGLYLTATATFLAYIACFSDSWVLLIEIKR